MSNSSGPFGIFAAFGREHQVALNDPGTLTAFIEHITKEVEGAIASDIRLYGHRTQNMFEALIVSLGRYRILKVEDTGRMYAKGSFRIPDFLVVLEDSRRWLVEVKNVFEKDAYHQETSFRPDYIDGLRAYAESVGGELKLAIFWARWSIWTVISVDSLKAIGDRLTVDMLGAARDNEIAAFGDASIGTTPPLRLRLLADRSKPRQIIEDDSVVITVSEGEVISGDKVITDEIDKSIAWLLMQFGEWKISGPRTIMSGELVDALEFLWEPRETSNSGFEMIGTLSRMFAGYFASQTLKDGKVVQIDAKAVPEWFSPLVNYDSHGNRQLPIWKFVISPNKSKSS